MFVNQLFPNPKLLHDVERSIGAPTTIISNGNREYRLQKDSNYRTHWKWPGRAMLSTEAKAIGIFMSEVANFGLNSFKFLDPYYNTWSNTQLSYTGTGTKYYLTLFGNTDTHPIYHLGGDVVVKVNGSVVAYTLVIENDVPVIQVPSAGTVTISGTFYFAVRLDQPEFSQTMSALTVTNTPLADTIGDIQLLEVFEY